MKSLSSKIGLGYVIIIGINVAIAVFAIYHINRLGSPINRILEEKYQNVNAAEGMIQSLQQQKIIQEALLNEPFDSTLAINYTTYKNEFYNWHQRAIEGIALASEPVILDSLLSVFRIYLEKSDTLLALAQKGVAPSIRRNYENEVITPIRSQLIKLSSKLRRVNENAIAEADSRARQFSNRATLIIIFISLLAILLSIFAGIHFTRSILKPVKKTTETVRRISQGQLNQKIEITTDDEIAELGREFNKMTERLQEYERLNINQILNEKKKSEAIVAGIPALIIVTDENGSLSLLNDRARNILDITENDWQGKPVEGIIKNQKLAHLISGKDSASANTDDFPRKLVTLHKGGRELFFTVKQIEIRDSGHNISGIVSLLQDVTRFKNLDRLKTEFMATISHEFKTPLTSINMSVDILLQETRGKLNELQRELLQDAKSDCRRLRELVQDLLDLSKLESGKQQMSFESIDFSILLEKVLHSLRFTIAEKDLKIEKAFEKKISEFQADRFYMARLLTNLLENAIQHTPASGIIIVRAENDERYLHVTVHDSGPGIPEEAIEVIFDKFVQVRDFQNAERGNIGLGLAISREIINAHHGQIWA
ncbi:MAG: ATP-binding protein, partial [Calditrichia bacterium]